VPRTNPAASARVKISSIQRLADESDRCGRRPGLVSFGESRLDHAGTIGLGHGWEVAERTFFGTVTVTRNHLAQPRESFSHGCPPAHVGILR
jgi:hypothetical protein